LLHVSHIEVTAARRTEPRRESLNPASPGASRLRRARYEYDLLGTVDIVLVLNQHSVAVKKTAGSCLFSAFGR
jgi:hypothetical protein